MKELGQIVIVGCGPGHPDYLTEAARKEVSSAELLVGAQHLIDLFPESSAERIAVGADMESLLEQLEAKDSQDVVVLTTGDTGLYSLARTLLKRFGSQRCRLVPGVSSVQLACARLALDWHDLKIVSAHGREPGVSVDDLSEHKKIAILAGTSEATRWAAGMLKALGDEYTAFACENLTWADERIREFDVAGLSTAELASRTVILLIDRGALT